MAQKRKAAASSPGKSPKGKKAKVEADPISDACKQLVKFFEETGSASAPGLAQMEEAITATIEPALRPAPAERHALEAVFASAIGEVLKVAVGEIDAVVASTGAQQAEVDAAEAAAAAMSEAGAAHHKAMTERVAAAKQVEKDAEEARNTAVESLETHQDNIKSLAVQKTKLEREEGELATGLELLKGPGSKQDAKKIVQLLKSCGVSDACCCALPNALGKTGGFDQLVLDEASKALGNKYHEVTQRQKNWEGHCQEMMDATQKLLDGAKAGADTLAQRSGETAGAQEEEKAAKKAKKEAESKLAEAKKEVAKFGKVSGRATASKEAASAASAAYEMLLLRPAPVEPVEAPAEMQVDEL